MMMPANYSAIAENELCYVDGGSILDIMVPVMNTQNWQNVSIALVKTLGTAFANATMGKVTSSFLNGNGMPTMYMYDNDGRFALDVRKVVANVMGCAAMIWTMGQSGSAMGTDLGKNTGIYNSGASDPTVWYNRDGKVLAWQPGSTATWASEKAENFVADK